MAAVQSVHRYSIESKNNVLEYHLDIISKDRKLMIRTDDMESQIRWAVAIENAAPEIIQDNINASGAKRPRSAVLPLPLRSPEEEAAAAAASSSTKEEEESDSMGAMVSHKSTTPNVAMLRSQSRDFHTVKTATHLVDDDAVDVDVNSIESVVSSSSTSSQPSTPLGRYRKISMHMDDLDKESNGGGGGDKGLRGTLRKINRGKCLHETNIVKTFRQDVTKNDATIQFLMNCIGSSSHPDMIKLNIFSRLDDQAIAKLATQMFCVPIQPNALVIEEGNSGEIFYIVYHGKYDVTVDKNNPMNQRRNSVTREGIVESKDGTIHCDVLVRGQVFGEGALLNATRLATVRCATDSTYTAAEADYNGSSDTINTAEQQGGILYGLHRDSYQRVVREYEQRVKKERLSLLKSIPMFTQGKLTNRDLLKLVDALEEEVFEFGATIVRKGEAKKKLYIVTSGTVIADESNAQVWSKGEAFGARALLYEENWDVGVLATGEGDLKATQELMSESRPLDRKSLRHVSTTFETGTITSTPTTVLSLHRKELNSLLGGLKEKILNSWVRERRNSVHAMAVDNVTSPNNTPLNETNNASDESGEPVQTTSIAMEEEDNNEVVQQIPRVSSVDLAQRSLEQGVVLARLSVGSLLNKNSASKSTQEDNSTSGDDDNDDDDMDDEEEDDDGQDDGEEDDEDDYDSSGELDLDWDATCTVLNPNIQFADLEPRALLGAGSFGSVQLVLDKSTQRHYALKLMSRSYITENGWEEMVEHERNAMMELAGTSKFLINLYNTYSDQYYIYMLMELCTGGELYEYLCSQEDKCVSVGAMRFCKLHIHSTGYILFFCVFFFRVAMFLLIFLSFRVFFKFI